MECTLDVDNSKIEFSDSICRKLAEHTGPASACTVHECMHVSVLQNVVTAIATGASPIRSRTPNKYGPQQPHVHLMATTHRALCIRAAIHATISRWLLGAPHRHSIVVSHSERQVFAAQMPTCAIMFANTKLICTAFDVYKIRFDVKTHTQTIVRSSERVSVCRMHFRFPDLFTSFRIEFAFHYECVVTQVSNHECKHLPLSERRRFSIGRQGRCRNQNALFLFVSSNCCCLSGACGHWKQARMVDGTPRGRISRKMSLLLPLSKHCFPLSDHPCTSVRIDRTRVGSETEITASPVSDRSTVE